MMIIPAMDVLDGRVVRLRRGSFDDVQEYPVSVPEQLRRFQQAGVSWVHVVDLTAARGSTPQWSLLSAAARKAGVHIQMGGGIRSVNAAMECLKTLADRIVVGTAAVGDPQFLAALAERNVQDRVVIAIDMENRRIQTHGWLLESDTSWEEFVGQALTLGYRRFLCTDISRDGMMCGTHVALYREMVVRFPALRLIASGGVRDVGDFQPLALAGVEAVVVGKAYYEGQISLDQISDWNRCSQSV